MQYLDTILALDGRKDFDIPIIRRAVLRFALTFRDEPAAARFIVVARVLDADAVERAEDLLRAETGSNQTSHGKK